MSYRIYSTRGFVLGSAPSGEASRSYLVYTEDFGLIRARAQGVRLLASKLRYTLLDHRFLVLSLVRGKEYWRITGSVSIEEQETTRSLELIRARIFSLVRRLVQGEEKNEELFGALETLFSKEASQTVDRDDLHAFEALILARSLASLGYLDLNRHIPDQSLRGVKENYRRILPVINKVIQETQL